MDRTTGRPDNITDYLKNLHQGQWFGFSDDNNQVYANLIIHDGSAKPTEQECTDGLKARQDAWDLENDSYKSNRKKEYPSIQDLVVALYDTDDKAAIDEKRAEIKLKYPKP